MTDQLAHNRLSNEKKIVESYIQRRKSQLAQLPTYQDAPEKEVDVVELFDELERRRAVNKENRRQRIELQAREGLHRTNRTAADHLIDRIEELKANLIAVDQEGERLAGQVESQKAVVEELKDADTQEIEAQIKGANEANRKFQSNLQALMVGNELANLEARLESLNSQLAAVVN